MENDDDDPVIHEFDLNLNSNSTTNLFSFAAKDYPFASGGENDAQNNPLLLDSIRMKPNLKQFEIKLQFNETNKTLCKKKNTELRKQKKHNENRLMKFKLLKSNFVSETSIKYGLCYLTKKKKVLNVVPIGKVVDFQTDFTQSDEDRNQQQQQQQHNEQQTPLTSPTKQQGEDVSNEMVQNFTLRYETNFDYSSWSHVNYCKLRERADREQWQTLQLIKKDLDQWPTCLSSKRCADDCEISANDGCENMYCLVPRELVKKQTLDGNEYESIESVSLAKLSRLQLSEKISQLLINCRVIPFSRLLSLLNFKTSDEELVIKILQKYAMLVQGNWVVKSEVLYPNPSGTNELALVHDFLSLSFNKKLSYKRKDLNSQIRFPSDSLLLVLEKLAIFDEMSRKWTFMYATDNDFLKRHSNLKEQQQLLWNVRSKNLYLQVEKFRDKCHHVAKKTEEGLEKSKIKLAANNSKRNVRRKRVRII